MYYYSRQNQLIEGSITFTSLSNSTNNYKVSLVLACINLFTILQASFYAYTKCKLTVYHIQVENRLTFAYCSSTIVRLLQYTYMAYIHGKRYNYGTNISP